MYACMCLLYCDYLWYCVSIVHMHPCSCILEIIRKPSKVYGKYIVYKMHVFIIFFQQKKLKILKVYLTDKTTAKKERWDTSFIYWFFIQMSAVWDWRQSQELHLGFPHCGRSPGTGAITHCCLGCTLAESWIKKWRWDLMPGPVK